MRVNEIQFNIIKIAKIIEIKSKIEFRKKYNRIQSYNYKAIKIKDLYQDKVKIIINLLINSKYLITTRIFLVIMKKAS